MTCNKLVSVFLAVGFMIAGCCAAPVAINATTTVAATVASNVTGSGLHKGELVVITKANTTEIVKIVESELINETTTTEEATTTKDAPTTTFETTALPNVTSTSTSSPSPTTAQETTVSSAPEATTTTTTTEEPSTSTESPTTTTEAIEETTPKTSSEEQGILADIHSMLRRIYQGNSPYTKQHQH